MGSVITAGLGGGEQTGSTVKPDAEATALNKIKREQLEKLFEQQSLASFAKDRPELYQLSDRSNTLLRNMTGAGNRMSLDEYMQLGLDSGKSYLSQVATPEIMNTLALQGQARSGAAPEAIAKATAGIALPFLESIPAFQQANTQSNATLLNMSDIPRQLKAQDYARQQGVVTSGFTGIPFHPGSLTTGEKSSLPLANLFGFGGSL